MIFDGCNCAATSIKCTFLLRFDRSRPLIFDITDSDEEERTLDREEEEREEEEEEGG